MRVRQNSIRNTILMAAMFAGFLFPFAAMAKLHFSASNYRELKDRLDDISTGKVGISENEPVTIEINGTIEVKGDPLKVSCKTIAFPLVINGNKNTFSTDDDSKGVFVIDNFAGSIEINSCTFSKCAATFSTDDACGGAVYVSHCPTVNIRDCNFSNCKTGVLYAHGGATYIEHCSTVNIRDCNFSDCESSAAYACGGAIYVSHCQTVNIGPCHFINCNSSSVKTAYGGAIYAFKCTVSKISICSFDKCAATAIDGDAHGGAIYASYCPTLNTTDACSFNSCTTSSTKGKASGNAIYAEEASINCDEKTTFTNCGDNSVVVE